MNREEIGNRLKLIRRAVDYARYTKGEGNYKIEIGGKALDKYIEGLGVVPMQEEGVAPQIMGIPIEINYSKPDIIKLWKEVEI